MHGFLKPKKVSASNCSGATSDDILEEIENTLKLMNSGRTSIL